MTAKIIGGVLRCLSIGANDNQLSHSKTVALHEICAHWCQSEPVSLALELSVMAH